MITIISSLVASDRQCIFPLKISFLSSSDFSTFLLFLSFLFGINRFFPYLCRQIKSRILMTQLVVTLKDQSYLPNIRRIVKSLVGVEKVTTAKAVAKPTTRSKRLSRYEKSLLDAKEGRVNSYESSEEFFKKMGI